jgi:hypothetical protein
MGPPLGGICSGCLAGGGFGSAEGALRRTWHVWFGSLTPERKRGPQRSGSTPRSGGHRPGARAVRPGSLQQADGLPRPSPPPSRSLSDARPRSSRPEVPLARAPPGPIAGGVGLVNDVPEDTRGRLEASLQPDTGPSPRTRPERTGPAPLDSRSCRSPSALPVRFASFPSSGGSPQSTDGARGSKTRPTRCLENPTELAERFCFPTGGGGKRNSIGECRSAVGLSLAPFSHRGMLVGVRPRWRSGYWNSSATVSAASPEEAQQRSFDDGGELTLR